MTTMLTAWSAIVGAALGDESASQTPIRFNRDIRPILSDNCFQCHGPDEDQRKARLRLDTREGSVADLDGRQAIVPGDAAASELYRRITAADPRERMPHADSGKKLAPRQIAMLRQWIGEGAQYEGHWSFLTPRRIDPPSVVEATPANNTIDRFVLARIAELGISPAPEADRRTLIRRVSLDLTGLPPTPAQVEAFVSDRAPDAYERLVDRLLRSPHYGEHMARYWLDAARYADTHGLHLDFYREIWPYRDWVIGAFNQNMPYDQFTIWQLAGDLLPDADLDAVIATGFNRAHVTTNEAGSIEEEVHIRNVVDRVETFGTVFLGLTLGCAVCHDHKYDPITQKDFYQLSAFFNSVDSNPMDGNLKAHPPVVRVPQGADRAKVEQLEAQIAYWESALRAEDSRRDAEQQLWVQRLARGELAIQPSFGGWSEIGPFQAATFDEAHDHNFGPEPRGDGSTEYQGQRWRPAPQYTDGIVHAFELPTMSAIYLRRIIQAPTPSDATFYLGSDDGIKAWLNGELIHNNKTGRVAAADQDTVPVKLIAGDNVLLIKISQYAGGAGMYFRFDGPAIPRELAEWSRLEESARSDEQRQKLRDYFTRQIYEPGVAVRKELDALLAARQSIWDRSPTTLVWKESAPRDAFILRRGEYGQRGEKVAPDTPAALPPMPPDFPRNRLGLARWLVRGDHPLTARVAVNRFWQQLWGAGLVETSEDFGAQGDWPSHPELLDWLATEFVRSGWDVKGLMRLMVTSRTYRQSSRISHGLYQADPSNRWLARGPRFRLDAEMLRDQALFASGLLYPAIGGPSVKPPQPAGLWEAVSFIGSDTAKFQSDTGHEKVHRRSLYTFWKRQAPPPQMSTFDAPTRESCAVRRERTNTPLQALLLMNDLQFVEAARHVAQRALSQTSGRTGECARRLFELVLARAPEADELDSLLAVYQHNFSAYQTDPSAAAQLLTIGEAPADQSWNPAELAAWTMVANLILNLDETVNKN